MRIPLKWRSNIIKSTFLLLFFSCFAKTYLMFFTQCVIIPRLYILKCQAEFVKRPKKCIDNACCNYLAAIIGKKYVRFVMFVSGGETLAVCWNFEGTSTVSYAISVPLVGAPMNATINNLLWIKSIMKSES